MKTIKKTGIGAAIVYLACGVLCQFWYANDFFKVLGLLFDLLVCLFFFLFFCLFVFVMSTEKQNKNGNVFMFFLLHQSLVVRIQCCFTFNLFYDSIRICG